MPNVYLHPRILVLPPSFLFEGLQETCPFASLYSSGLCEDNVTCDLWGNSVDWDSWEHWDNIISIEGKKVEMALRGNKHMFFSFKNFMKFLPD